MFESLRHNLKEIPSEYKNWFSLGILFALVIALPVMIWGLTRGRFEVRKQASVPGGQATVSISPATGDFQVNQPFSADISFNTANIPISAIAIRITYPYSGATPELTVSGIQINPALGDWTCPVKTITPQGGTVQIDIACTNTSINGFASSNDTLLASLDLIATSIPTSNPVVLSFDPSLSIITQKSDSQDILNTPTGTGSYTINNATPTPTSTPTPTPTSSPTPTPTGSPTPTPTPTPTGGQGGPISTSTPTPGPACRDSLPAVPTNLSAISGPNIGQVALSWSKVSGADHYGLVFGPGSGHYLYGATDIGKSGQYTVLGLNPGSRYYFAVTAINGCASSAFSQETSAIAKAAEIIGATGTNSPMSTTKTSPSPTPAPPYKPAFEVFPKLFIPIPTPTVKPTPIPQAETLSIKLVKGLIVVTILILLGIVLGLIINRRRPGPPTFVNLSESQPQNPPQPPS